MKNLFFCASLVLLLVSCETPGNDNTTENNVDSTYCLCHDLILDQPYNHFYLTDRTKGYTGDCEDFHANGQLKESKSFVEGKVHGKVFTYYDNGQLQEEKEFDMNFQTGEQITYTKKGEVRFHALYKRGNQTNVLVARPDLDVVDEWDSLK